MCRLINLRILDLQINSLDETDAFILSNMMPLLRFKWLSELNIGGNSMDPTFIFRSLHIGIRHSPFLGYILIQNNRLSAHLIGREVTIDYEYIRRLKDEYDCNVIYSEASNTDV